jgi:acyl carrier protein
MANTTNVTALILDALAELNQQLPPEQQLPVSSGTPLFGHAGRLDSLGLVNLILLVEERVQSEFGVEVTLSDDRALSQQDSLFRNVQTLTEHVCRLIEADAQQADKVRGL